MKNVLITGGAGFIGSNLAALLGNTHYNIYAFDNLHPQIHQNNGRPIMLPDYANLLPGDVTHRKDWDAVLKLIQPDIIVHLAAETGTGQSLTEASRHGNVNVVGTTNMIDALTRAKINPDHIILASSRAVYGEGAWKNADGSIFYPSPRPHKMLESNQWDFAGKEGKVAIPIATRADITPPNPSNVYAATKLAQEHILNAWTNATGVRLSTLRLQNVYGPGQSLQNSYTGVVAFFARVAQKGGVIEVYEDGNIVRDFVYIDDVTTAIKKAIINPPNDKRVLDVGLGEKISILKLAQLTAKIFDAPEPKITGRYRDGDVRSASCDITKTTDDLGFTPRWQIENGLHALAKWVLTQTTNDSHTLRPSHTELNSLLPQKLQL